MKKHIHRFFALTLAVFTVFGASAQDFDILLVEDFNVTQTQTPPAPWVEFVQDPADPALGGTSDGWEFGVASYTGAWTVPASLDASGFAIANDDPDPLGGFTGQDRRDDQLLVGLFDMTGYDSLTILIDKFFNAQFGSSGFFLVGNATQAVIFPVEQGAAWGLDELTVVNGETYVTAAGPLVFDTDMIIGFVHNDNSGWADGLAIDNVILAGWLPPCETTGLTQEPATPVAAVGGTTTTISASQDLGGEFSVVTNVQGSTEYIIDHTGGAYATVRTGSAAGPVLDFGVTPLTITTLSTDDLYIIWSADNACSPGDGSTNTSSITGGAQVCAAESGTLFQPNGVDVCLGDEVVAAAGLPPAVPSGFSIVYVVTDGAGNVVAGPFPTPTYTPTVAGTYFLHTMVFDPADEAAILAQVPNGAQAVANLFEENGGALCGSIDLAGAGFIVAECPDNNDCEDATMLECGAPVAGTNVNGSLDVTGLGETVWYTFQGNGQNVTFSNCNNGNFDSFFALWTGECGNIENIAVNDDATGCAGFTSELTWYAHPDTLYYLSVSGLSEGEEGTFTIEASCACPAGLSEGSLTAASDVVCLDQNGEADISAAQGTAPGVPEGYGITYVLTSNPGLIIEGVNPTSPDFTVDASGEYTIHTLVSANTLDLGVVDLGVTPASAVLGIVSGDDNICAALDVTGASIEVPGAGTLTADATPVCLDGNGEAVISATHADLPYVPAGYEVSYALTMGANLTIMQASTAAEFTVNVDGDYTIHTLVHESSFDPLTVITPGVTTGGEVNALLVQGGGAVCAALDVPGAPIVVEACIVGIQDLAEGTLAVYPNPSNGEFVIEIDGVEAMAQINVTDLAGKVIFTEAAVLNGNFRKEFNIDAVSGTYLLQIVTEEGMLTHKLQVK